MDRQQLQTDLGELIIYYTELPIGDIDLSHVIKETLEVIRRHHIVLPPDLSLLATVIIKLEGTGRQLDPSFQLMSRMQSYQENIFQRKLSPARQFRKISRIGREMDRLLEQAPASLSEVLQQLEKGRFTVQLQLKNIESAQHHLEKCTNRIAFGILTASMILASSIILFAEVPPIIGGYSGIGIAGYVISTFFGLRLLWAIFRSGNLN